MKVSNSSPKCFVRKDFATAAKRSEVKGDENFSQTERNIILGKIF